MCKPKTQHNPQSWLCAFQNCTYSVTCNWYFGQTNRYVNECFIWLSNLRSSRGEMLPNCFLLKQTIEFEAFFQCQWWLAFKQHNTNQKTHANQFSGADFRQILQLTCGLPSYLPTATHLGYFYSFLAWQLGLPLIHSLIVTQFADLPLIFEEMPLFLLIFAIHYHSCRLRCCETWALQINFESRSHHSKPWTTFPRVGGRMRERMSER